MFSYILSYGFIFHGCRIAFNKRECCFSLSLWMLCRLSLLPCARINLGCTGLPCTAASCGSFVAISCGLYPFMRIIGQFAVFFYFLCTLSFWFIQIIDFYVIRYRNVRFRSYGCGGICFDLIVCSCLQHRSLFKSCT